MRIYIEPWHGPGYDEHSVNAGCCGHVGIAGDFLIRLISFALREGRRWRAGLSDMGETLSFIYPPWDVSLGAVYQNYSHQI